MMKNTDPRVDTYIAKSAEFARPILKHVRSLVHRACPDVEETMKWSFPHYRHAGHILCGTAAFKAHCALGFWHQDLRASVAKDSHKFDAAMGQFGRIASLTALPNDKTMLRYLRRAVALAEAGTRARPVPKPRPALPVPADLATALRKSKAASAAFEKLSPSHRHEYVEWITEAKRDETRRKRLATTLEWLADGKSRNWKYAKC
jgi:uncharacterized protein YdeI (YjbR/CyaY-like superfamily)